MKRISFIAISGVLMFSASAALAAYDFTGPTQGPTGGNTPGVIWNVDGTSVTQPSAVINIGQVGKTQNLLGDVKLSDTAAFRVDKAGSSAFSMGNWGSGAQPYTFNIYGDIYSHMVGAGGAAGKYGQITTDGQVKSYTRIDAPQYCIGTGGVNCITSWPSGGGGGTISSIAVGSGLTVTNPTGPTATIGLSSSCAAGQILKWNGASWACAADTDTNSGGTLTGITAGTGATISGGAPSPTINVTDLYVNTSGDTMSGNLTMTNAYLNGTNLSGYGAYLWGLYGLSARGSGTGARGVDSFIGSDVTNGRAGYFDASTAAGTSYGIYVRGSSSGAAARFENAGNSSAVEINTVSSLALSVMGNTRLGGAMNDSTTVSGTLTLIAPTSKLCLGTSAGLPDCRTSWPTSGTPGGSNTQIQYNNSGVFAGDSKMTWDSANSLFKVTGGVSSTAASGQVAGRFFNTAEGTSALFAGTSGAIINGPSFLTGRLVQYDSALPNSTGGLELAAADRPFITRAWDLFTSGKYANMGRWGLFMEPSAITIGMPNIAGKYFVVAKYNADSTKTDLLSVADSGDISADSGSFLWDTGNHVLQLGTPNATVSNVARLQSTSPNSTMPAISAGNSSNLDYVTMVYTYGGVGYGVNASVDATDWGFYTNGKTHSTGNIDTNGYFITSGGLISFDGTPDQTAMMQLYSNDMFLNLGANNALYIRASGGTGTTGSPFRLYSNGELHSYGNSSGYYFTDRNLGGTEWAWYSNGGYAYLGNSSGGWSSGLTQSNSGYVGIGRAPSYKIDVAAGYGRVDAGYSWLVSSDERLKKNISTLQNPLENISKLRGVRYDLRSDQNSVLGEGKNIGFIAQELEKTYPELVTTDDKGYKSVAYDRMGAVLVEGVKQLKAENDKLKTQNESLEWRLRVLEAKMDALMK